MNKKTVVLIKSNLMSEETRRPKWAKILVGYRSIALSWDRGRKSSVIGQYCSDNFYEEVRLKLKAPFGIKGFLFLPIWWCFLFFWLIVTKWDIVHVINFDSIIPAIVIGKMKKKPVIYEILDIYVDQIFLPNWIRCIGIKADKLFMRFASAIIIADEAQIEEICRIPNSKIIPIYDSPPDIVRKINLSHQKNDVFTLFFAGMLFSARRLNINKIFAAAEGVEDIKILIVGYGDLVDEIKKMSDKMPDKIQFIGKDSYEKALKRSAEADLLFVFRDPIVPVNKYVCGSKLLEAMMCGKPILVNKGTSTANKVREENCGLIVNANNIEEIKEAIIKLRDNPELCKKLGANGRKAYEQTYSWEIMERRLITLYQELTGEVRKRNKRLNDEK